MNRPADLIAFDIDGTLIRGPGGFTVWELFNERFCGDATVNRERYARYKSGEISYEEWVALDVRGWREAGAKRELLVSAIRESLAVVDGVEETLEELERAGYKIYAVSGTLDLVVDTLLPRERFREVYCNHIGFDDDGTISHWRATPFDMDGKAEVLRALSFRESTPLSRCAFVGDSSNDLWIAEAAGLSIAFDPKTADLERAADVVVPGPDLRGILPHLIPR